MEFDLLIKNGTCVLPSGSVRADIGISREKITAIGDINQQRAKKIIDAGHLHVLPGVIDTQVHFREPGNEHKEDLETGTKAAALGGVTAIFEMPNTNPPTCTEVALNNKIALMEGRAWCDFAFFIGANSDKSTDWRALEQLPGCCGIKIFMGSSTGPLLVPDDETIQFILQHSQRRCAVHCEDEARLKSRYHLAEEGKHARFHPIWRDAESAFLATQRMVKLAQQNQHPVHILHVTTAQEMQLLSKHKSLCTVEVLPQHLTFTDDIYNRLGNFAQMNPPIRDKNHQEALWQAITEGVVDVIGSDHAPHTREEKNKPYPKSPAGMPGVQTLVPVMLTHVNDGKLSIERFVELTSSGPARVYNIANKGGISIGNDADFTLVDMKAEKTIDNKDMASKCGWTPYHDMKAKGWPTATVIRGDIVMQEGELQGKPAGKIVEFL